MSVAGHLWRMAWRLDQLATHTGHKAEEARQRTERDRVVTIVRHGPWI